MPLKLPAITGAVEKIMVASVVPALDRKLSAELKKRFGVRPRFITAGNITKIKVRLKNKEEIGADRVVDALAAYALYGGPAIIVDFGTAATFDVISAGGEYLGGAIAPGITLARDALHHQTAKLPRIELKAPKNVIGRNTVEAMRSGLVYGYVAMVEGMVERIKLQITKSNLQTIPKLQKSKPKIKVIATGGLARLICQYTRVVDKIDDKLTLKGLQIVGEIDER